MKKVFSLWVLSLLVLWLAWCWNASIEDETINSWDSLAESIEDEYGIDVTDSTNVMDVMTYFITYNLACDYQARNYVNLALLWKKELSDWYSDYYVLARSEAYSVNSRWDLISNCWYSIPMKLTVSENDGIYAVNDYEQAKDWSEYTDSLKEMFSNEAIEKLNKWDYKFYDNRSLLEMAEEALGVKIIPEEKKEYNCAFCDKVWYYEPSENEDWKSNDLVFNYIAKDNWNNTIFFGSDWKFEAKGSWDEGEGTWVFWNNENSVIVSSSQNENVYDRYIITNQDDENLNTILEIIQRN